MCICDVFLKFILLLFRQLDVRLLEKMKLNCQVFKEEISLVHLNRQVSQLQNALQESYVKVLFIVLFIEGLELLEFNQQHAEHNYTNMWENCTDPLRQCFHC